MVYKCTNSCYTKITNSCRTPLTIPALIIKYVMTAKEAPIGGLVKYHMPHLSSNLFVVIHAVKELIPLIESPIIPKKVANMINLISGFVNTISGSVPNACPDKGLIVMFSILVVTLFDVVVVLVMFNLSELDLLFFISE